MHFKSISPAAALLLLSTLASVGDCSCEELAPVIAALSQLGPAATPFCNSYLGIMQSTVTAATVTPVVTATTTSTVSTTIRVDKRAAATLAARACSDFGQSCQKLRRHNTPGVPDPLAPFPAAHISSACAGFTATATTVTATLAPTTTTTTVLATATTTVKRGVCDPDSAYSTGGNGNGNQFITIPATSSLDCCQKCQASDNCVANAFIADVCQILEKVTAAPGAVPAPQCPLGREDYDFGPHVDGGMVFSGPCGY